MSHLHEKHLGKLSDPCAVCGTLLANVEHPLTEEVMEEIVGICSEKCRTDFLKDPQKYLDASEQEADED